MTDIILQVEILKSQSIHKASATPPLAEEKEPTIPSHLVEDLTAKQITDFQKSTCKTQTSSCTSPPFSFPSSRLSQQLQTHRTCHHPRFAQVSRQANLIDYRSSHATSTRDATKTSDHTSATSAKASHTGAAGAVNAGDMGRVMVGVLGVAALL
jgi:hypothetical protein